MHAWHTLTTCRSLTDMEPIPWTAAYLWAQSENMNRDSLSDLWYYIQILDDVYLTVVAEKRKNV